ncbi:DNA cytosine methyltransferase [Vibrio parahaemolyticus]|uniref:DNA cytosine methyltransferase n=7 Tax=Gammaproteobacteria TaxID=1236 RepID=A0AA47JMW2_VIBPH|nr:MULTISPECIES: DNA cytosine methyltransferase [Vibrio]EGR1442641.1 hypothetical protein [Vibrio parahaemolyticus]EGR3506703.1 hypothetical protein [Vibrio parahaemolyticus]MBO0154422.1 DNA cytosine methyltransferase [Vibrio parahaemolyticus]MBO0159078.1 DNA cytosine methyltransferase [Vibrio parahaemolyticus]MBO0165397.1 DNA cytosine methyltransferase [Vibrio alginolyticus]
MIKVLEKKVSLHRNKLRVFFEGQYLLMAGFKGGAKFQLKSDRTKKEIKIVIDRFGSRQVTNSRRNGKERPVIDLKHADLDIFGDHVKAYIKDGEIRIVELHSVQEIHDRELRFKDMTRNLKPLNHAVFSFNSNLVLLSNELEYNSPIELFDLKKSSIKAEVISLQGAPEANCYFYLMTAFIKTLQPSAIFIDTQWTEPLEAAFSHTMKNMGYVKSDELNGYLSKNISGAELGSASVELTPASLIKKLCLDRVIKTWRNLKQKERVQRAMSKYKANIPLSTSDIFNGIGVLCSSISDGLKRSNLSTFVKVIVESSERYFNACLQNNPVWAGEAPEEQYGLNMRLESVDLSRGGVRTEVNSGSLPCEGSSISGRSKNGNKFAEAHKNTGGCFIDFLHWQSITNPIISVFENVTSFTKSNSYAVIVDTFSKVFGYNFINMTLAGSQFGALEDRKRLCGIGYCSSFKEGLKDFMPQKVRTTYKYSCLADVLDDIPETHESYKPYTYLVEKEKRDIAQKKGFRLQWLKPTATKVGCITKSYQKCRSTDPFLIHSNGKLARLFTTVEHAKCKQIPESFVRDLTVGLAHECLGQSVIYSAFCWVGEWVGKWLNNVLNTQYERMAV